MMRRDQGAPEGLQSWVLKGARYHRRQEQGPGLGDRKPLPTLFFPGKDQKLLSGAAEVKVLWTLGHLSQPRVTVR